MGKKSINDDDFFDDAHLDEVGEAIGVLDPDEGEPAGDEGEDGDPSAEGEPAGEESEDGAGEDAGEEAWVDPAPHLPDDPRVLKAAFAEVRKYADRVKMDFDKAEQARAQAEAEVAASYEYQEQPSYDAQAFTQMAAQDPREAFAYALQNGQSTDAIAAIAKVQADAQAVAARAALAERDGEHEAFEYFSSHATQMNALAQSMQGQYNTAVHQAQQAPLVAAEQARNLVAAEQYLAQSTAGDFTAKRDLVVQVLRERPHLITGHSAQEIHRGLSDAYTIAKTMPAPAGSPAAIDDIVKNAVDSHLAATRRAKKEAGDAAVGADAGRTGPAGGSSQPSEKDRIYSQQRAASMGARKFMDL